MKSGHDKMFTKRIAYLVIVAWGCQLLAGPLWAAPQGGAVTTGTVTINQSGNVTNINQATQKAAINWQSFSTKPQETVNFNQPNSSSITLNRVIGNERSVLGGALNANGRVFLINSNGILFTKGSTVNTAGFIASTLNLTDEDFNAGNYVFKSNGSTGSVINMGTITAKDGGYVGLLGNSVSNQGIISATKGTVAMASGDKMMLNFNGDSLLSVTVDEAILNTLVENKEAVYADGGTVIMTAKAADDLLSAQVNSSGIIQARTVDDLKGGIKLYADGGTSTVSGTLDASAPTTGDGGFIETSGDKAKITDTALITTKSASGKNGTWLIDPTDFTIGGGGDITASLLSTLLGYNNITLYSTDGRSGTEGDINVNGPVMWSANTALFLDAATDINVNAPITASGDDAALTLAAGADINVNKDITLSGTNGALTMNYEGDYHILTPATYSGAILDANGQPVANQPLAGTEYAGITLSGSNATLTMNGTPYTLIHSMDQLAALDDATGTATGSYALAQDLDATAWSGANDGAPSVIANLSGIFAGLGHAISNLTLNNSTRYGYVGLIGQTSGATSVIRDTGLVGAGITATGRMGNVGGLLGYARPRTTINQAYITGGISSAGGASYGGGLVGVTGSGTSITYSYSEADIIGGSGGLVGYAADTMIAGCHVTGNVTSNGSSLGGLVGYYDIRADGYGISNCYAKGVVNAPSSNDVGGLIGTVSASRAGAPVLITGSFATGAVTGFNHVGGLVGYAQGYYSASRGTTRRVTVDNCYAAGVITGTGGTRAGTQNSGRIGGLIGWAKYTDVSHSHATGDVISAVDPMTEAEYQLSLNFLGGLVGYLCFGSIADSYAAGNVVGQGSWVNSYVGGLVGYADSSVIDRCHGTGDVRNGYRAVGGLAGCFTGTMNDSWASGNVSGHTEVGGLVGGLGGGTINRSMAYGNVTGFDYTYYWAPIGKWITEKSDAVGGLAGFASGEANIDHSTALGDVIGGERVGGLVGGMVGGSISDSAASGRVTGTGDSVGGIAGETIGGVSIDSSYWNIDGTGQSNAVGTVIDGYEYEGSPTLTLTNTQGLTTEQWNDLPYYRDGSIDQVLADRAAAKVLADAAAAQTAARQAAFEDAATTEAGRTTAQALQYQEELSGPAGNDAEEGSLSVDEHIVFADSGSYSAHIKAISADGMEFELDEEERKARKK
jgi:filamentous hemagglutinin family protein